MANKKKAEKANFGRRQHVVFAAIAKRFQSEKDQLQKLGQGCSVHVSSLPSSVYTVPSCLSAAAKKSHTKPKNISDGTRLLSQQLPQAAIAFANTAIGPSKEAESANSARGEIKASWQLLGTLHKKASLSLNDGSTSHPPSAIRT